MKPDLQRVHQSLQAAGLRMTAQRAVVVESALSSTRPFTSDALLIRLQSEKAGISRATVYRTLHVLNDQGFLRRLPLGTSQTYFEVVPPDPRSQKFVRCLECDEMVPFGDFCLDLQQASLAKRMGFQLKESSVIIEAHCDVPGDPERCARMRSQP